jgi:hypothetical protein
MLKRRKECDTYFKITECSKGQVWQQNGIFKVRLLEGRQRFRQDVRK